MGIIKIPSMRRTDSDPVSAKRKPSDFFYFAISHGNHRIKSGLRNPAKEIAAFVRPASTIASGSAKGVFIKNLLPYFSIVSDRNGNFQVFPDSQITVSQVIIGFGFEAQILLPCSRKDILEKNFPFSIVVVRRSANSPSECTLSSNSAYSADDKACSRKLSVKQVSGFNREPGFFAE